MTTTTLDDLDPALRAIATSWEVQAGPAGAVLMGEGRNEAAAGGSGASHGPGGLGAAR